MAIKELDKDVFGVCYLLFMVAVLLLPVTRNVYSIMRYKMSFSKYSKKIVDSFLEKNTCIYVAKYNGLRCIFLFVFLFFLVPCTISFIYSDNNYTQYYFLSLAAVFIIVHMGWIVIYISYLYDTCYITNALMLIRGVDTACSFKIIQLHDIEKYRTDNSYTLDRFFYLTSVIQNLTIITKCNKAFSLHYLGNREELIDALKSFTNSIEEIYPVK